jgi:hypothetical protein
MSTYSGCSGLQSGEHYRGASPESENSKVFLLGDKFGYLMKRFVACTCTNCRLVWPALAPRQTRYRCYWAVPNKEVTTLLGLAIATWQLAWFLEDG